MITLNLLPPKNKENFKLIRIGRHVFYFSIQALILSLVAFILLASVYLYLIIQLRAIEGFIAQEKNTETFKEATFMEKEIEQLNSRMKALDQEQANSKYFTVILEDLANMAPVNVQFTSFYYDDQTKKAVLSGYALARDDFLSFRDSLKAYPHFSNLESPITNLIQSTDNNFRVSFTIN